MATRAAHLALSFVLGLPSLCSFAQAAVSAARRAIIFNRHLLFAPIVCGVLHGTHQQHNSAILNPTKASHQQHDGSISTTPYIEKSGYKTAEKYT